MSCFQLACVGLPLCLIILKNVYLFRYPCPIDLIYSLVTIIEESRSEFDEVSLRITNSKKLNASYLKFRLGSWNVQGLNCKR